MAAPTSEQHARHEVPKGMKISSVQRRRSGPKKQAGNTIRSPIARAQEAARLGNATFALSTAISALKRHDTSCSVRECNKLMRVLGDGGHLDAMMGVFDAMVAAGVKPSQVRARTNDTVASKLQTAPPLLIALTH